MPPASRKGRPVERDRQAILQAARAVAATRGFDGLRFADVSEAANVPVSSLQYAFGSRDALARELLRAGVQEELNRLTAAVAQGSDPWSKVQNFVRASVTVDPVTRRDGWVIWIEFWRGALRDRQLRQEYGDVARQWQSLVHSAVAEGMVDGSFTPAGSAWDATALVIAIADGLGLQVEVGDGGMTAERAVELALAATEQVLGVDRA
jgi:AcrR family transcriptional regulator